MTSPARTPHRRIGSIGSIGLQALLAATILAWVFRGVLVGDVLLQADLHQLIEPLRQVLARAVRAGEFTWTSSLGNGSPLLGNPLHALAYPPNWLCLLIEPARALSVLCLLHSAWGAVGAWLLARERGATAAAAWTAAAAFTLCGVGLSVAMIPTLGWSLAWLPWLVIAHARLRSRRHSPWPVLALALILTFLLVIAEPTLVFAALFWIALAELRPLLRGRGRRLPWRTLLACSLGLGLALPAIVPMMSTVGESVRAAGFEREGMLQWSLHPAEPIAWIVPGVLGDSQRFGLEGHWAEQLWPDRVSGFYHGTYWGGLVICLAAAGVASPGRRRTELLAWLGLLLLLALGRHGPIFPWLSHVPLADSWRYPVKWLTPMSLPIALLAARGVQSLGRRNATRTLMASAALLLLTCLTLALGARAGLADLAWSSLGPGGDPPAWFSGMLSSAGWSGALPLILGAALIALASRRGRVSGVAPALGAVLTLELLLANSGLVPTVPLAAYRDPPAAVEVLRGEGPALERLWIEPAADLRWADEPTTRAQYHRWERDSLRLYMAASFNLPLAFPVDFEAMAPFRYARLSQMIATAPEREQLMLLGAAAVSHLGTFDERDQRWCEPLSTHEVRTLRPLRLYRNRLAMPRARLVGELVPYDSDQDIYRALASAPDRFFADAALVNAQDAPALLSSPLAGASTATLVDDQGHALVLHTSGAGFLIVSDPLVAGWSAELDGEPVDMFRADIAFRGLVLPPGEHEVRMRFSPW